MIAFLCSNVLRGWFVIEISLAFSITLVAIISAAFEAIALVSSCLHIFDHLDEEFGLFVALQNTCHCFSRVHLQFGIGKFFNNWFGTIGRCQTYVTGLVALCVIDKGYFTTYKNNTFELIR